MVVFYAWLTLQRDPAAPYQWYGVAAPNGSPTPASRAIAERAQSLPRPGAVTAKSCPAPS